MIYDVELRHEILIIFLRSHLQSGLQYEANEDSQ